MKCPKCKRFTARWTGFKIAEGKVYKCKGCGKVFVNDGCRKDARDVKPISGGRET